MIRSDATPPTGDDGTGEQPEAIPEVRPAEFLARLMTWDEWREFVRRGNQR